MNGQVFSRAFRDAGEQWLAADTQAHQDMTGSLGHRQIGDHRCDAVQDAAAGLLYEVEAEIAGLNDDASIVGKCLEQVDAGQYVVERPARHGTPLVEQYQVIG